MRILWQVFGLIFLGGFMILAGETENPRGMIKTEMKVKDK